MMEHTARILSPTLPPELRYVTESINMLAVSLIIDDSIYSGLFLTIEIRWDTRCKKASRGYGQGATEVNWESNISIPVHCFLAWENVPMLAIVPPWRILRRFCGVISWSLFRSTIDTLAGSGTPLPCVPSGCPIQSWQGRVWQQSLEAGETSVKSVHVDSRVHSLSIEAIRRRSKTFNWR